MRVMLTVALILIPAPASATEYQFSCMLEQPVGAIVDPDAKSIAELEKLQSREFIFKIEPPEVVEPPAPAFIFGQPSVRLDAKEIRIEWPLNTRVARKPRLVLTVNRFSGKAVEILAMFEAAERGPEYGYWIRNGICEIHRRKL